MEVVYYECYVDCELCYWDVLYMVLFDFVLLGVLGGFWYWFGVYYSVGFFFECGGIWLEVNVGEFLVKVFLGLCF